MNIIHKLIPVILYTVATDWVVVCDIRGIVVIDTWCSVELVTIQVQ